MPAPTNQTALTAVDITAFPYSIAQDVTDGLGVTYTVWYKFTAPADAKVMSIFAYGGTPSAGYQPIIAGFLGPAAAPVQILSIAAQNKAIFTQVTGGVEYFFRFTKNGNFTPSVLTLKVEKFIPLAIPVGSILITSDQDVTPDNDYPGCIVSAINANDYAVLDYKQGTAAGEQGDSIPTGEILLWSSFVAPYDFKLYSPEVVLTGSVAVTGTGSGMVRSCQAGNCWYVGFTGSGVTNAFVKRISSAGAIGATTFTLAAPGLTALSANNAETVLFYSGATTSVNSALKRWNLTLNSALADLVADIGGTYELRDILCLADDTLIVLYFQVIDNELLIKHYNSTTGAVLHTYTMGGAWTDAGFPRICHALDDPTSFWIYLHPNGADDGYCLLRNIVVDTGATAAEVRHVEYPVGVYDLPETAVPVSLYGPYPSCPIMLIRISSSNEGSGIYVLDPGKTFDELYTEDVNIPDPIIKTALIGD